jgi:hypothetical protein
MQKAKKRKETLRRVQKSTKLSSNPITNLTCAAAKRFFLDVRSYCNFPLPAYFNFRPILDALDRKLTDKKLSDFYASNQKPSDAEGVNRLILNNKDGKYSWRPYSLIHPASYVSLAHLLTDDANWSLILGRFKDFQKDPRIRCCSIPVKSFSKQSNQAENIINWFNSIEQDSLGYALKYSHIIKTDISNCYSSIYTHSVSWALHKKKVSKANKTGNGLLGNLIDRALREMQHGQTNGIPQGSTLMDFIAEIVLGYADELLSEKLKGERIIEFQILRFRDDYRVFAGNAHEAEIIVKHLSEILSSLGMQLNPTKTSLSSDLISSSFKEDKLYWLQHSRKGKNYQERLLLIHKLAQNYPNSGSLEKALVEFFRGIMKEKSITERVAPLAAISVNIAYRNPRTYPITSSILSKLFSFLKSHKDREELAQIILDKFKSIPNTEYLHLWLQRATLKLCPGDQFAGALCKAVNGQEQEDIWNSEWLNKSLSTLIRKIGVIDRKKKEKLSFSIPLKEVELFLSTSSYSNS